MLTVHQVYLRLLPFGVKNGETCELWVQPKFPEVGDYNTRGYEYYIKADTRKRRLVVTSYTLERYPIAGTNESRVIASNKSIQMFEIDRVGNKMLDSYFGDASLICERINKAQEKSWNYGSKSRVII